LRLKTSSGVGILVREGENDKLISFDRQVSTVELSYPEARHLAYSLVRNGGRLSEKLRQMVESGFFQFPRSFADIRLAFQEEGIAVRSASVHVLVNGLVERGILLRDGKRRAYTYRMNLPKLHAKSN
jgi:hypothetical protein